MLSRKKKRKKRKVLNQYLPNFEFRPLKVYDET